MKSWSLKGRLVLLLLLAVGGVWLATVAYSYLHARHEIDEMLDGHLAQAAALLVVQAGGHEIEEIDTEHAPVLHKYARMVAFQVWEDGRKLRVHSANAPSAPLAGARAGFSEATVDGERWRVFTTWSAPGEALIHVGERIEAREELARELSLGLLKPLAVALPALALLLWLALRRGLAPLADVAAEVAARAPEALTPLAATGVPVEVRPLVDRLNRLFERVRNLLDNERRFTADAAHELRTPLAAIRAQAQVAQGAGADDAERRQALASVIAGCDRATRLVEQLLTLARLDAAPAGQRTRFGLRALAAEALADIAPAAARKNVELALADGDEVGIEGHDGLLRILLRNLLDNAIRYSPPASTVEVRVGNEGGRAVLVVSDSGPGIPAAECAKVVERFYRILGSGEDGSGLGLSIVQRIVELHGGRLELLAGAGGRGLRVCVGLPPAG